MKVLEDKVKEQEVNEAKRSSDGGGVNKVLRVIEIFEENVLG